MARLMTWKWTSMFRTFSTSRIQRDVIQQKGQSGSNQKSARSRTLAASALPSADLVRVEVTTSPFERAPAEGQASHRSAIQAKREKSDGLFPLSLAGYYPTGQCSIPTARSWGADRRYRQHLAASQQNPAAPDLYHNRIPQRS